LNPGIWSPALLPPSPFCLFPALLQSFSLTSGFHPMLHSQVTVILYALVGSDNSPVEEPQMVLYCLWDKCNLLTPTDKAHHYLVPVYFFTSLLATWTLYSRSK
jgi:hypothetical protein